MICFALGEESDPISETQWGLRDALAGLGLPVDANSALCADVAAMQAAYDALAARAWLEAQREVTQNQNIIYKPDSVLEYTCFDMYLNELAQDAESMFSESQRWGGLGISTSDMDIALTQLVGGPASTYQTSNFGHNSLGGKGDAIRTLSGGISGGAYNCTVMNAVWNQAKCRNFAEDPSEGFMTFDDLLKDPRKGCTAPAALYANKLTQAYLKTENDTVKTYFSNFDFSQSNQCRDSLQIATGLTVERPSGLIEIYQEKVCLTPGCYYEPSSETDGVCFPSETLDYDSEGP